MTAETMAANQTTTQEKAFSEHIANLQITARLRREAQSMSNKDRQSRAIVRRKVNGDECLGLIILRDELNIFTDELAIVVHPRRTW